MIGKVRVTVVSRRWKRPIKTLTVDTFEEAAEAAKEFPGAGAETVTTSAAGSRARRFSVVWNDSGESDRYAVAEMISDSSPTA